jgi:hypothetical protein
MGFGIRIEILLRHAFQKLHEFLAIRHLAVALLPEPDRGAALGPSNLTSPGARRFTQVFPKLHFS